MRLGRTVVLYVVGWVVVVVAGATLVWAVISQAGQGVTGDSETVPAADASASSGRSPGATDSSSPSSSPGGTDSPSGSPSGSPSKPSASPSGSESPPVASGPSVRRTWQGTAGYVAVECRGSAIDLTGAQPNSGWTIEPEDTGPARVRVDSESNGGDRDTRVESFCVDGVPTFEVDSD